MSTLEQWILLTVYKYERHQNKFINIIEYAVSGEIWKDITLFLLVLAVEFLPPSIVDRLNRLLVVLSRERQQLKHDEEQGWLPYILLTEHVKLNNRDLCIILMRSYLTSKGKIEILIALERQRAYSATFVIGIILLIYMAFLVTIWTALILDVPTNLIIYQIAVFAILSTVLFTVVLISAYILFFLGVVPLATTHRLMEMKRKLIFNGIPVQIR